MNHISDSIKHSLNKRQTVYGLRQRNIRNPSKGPLVWIGSDQLLNFCSNDYLGLADHPALITELKKSADEYGVGSGASHLMSGHTRAHAELEETLAIFTGRERALTFSTGYMANLAIITALAGRGDVVISDRLNHASLVDAAHLSGARLKRYQHADPDSLSKLLSTTNSKTVLVTTDSIFSMDGDIAPLNKLSKLCNGNACLVVDDAHGFGVLGKGGAGALEQFELSTKDVPVLMATFGKALGCFGAFVAGSSELIELLIQTARTYIYTTAPPPALAAVTRRALQLLDEENWRRQRLAEIIQHFKSNAKQNGLPVTDSMTAIQPIIIGGPEQAVAISRTLRKKGFFVPAIRPPTVPVGSSRLRISLTAVHTEQHIDALLDALAEIYRTEHASA